MQHARRARAWTDEALRERFRQAGLKVTPQRTAIYRALLSSGEHPSPEVLFTTVAPRVPGLSLATIYKTLDALEKVGLISQVSTLGELKRYDANRDHHHHLICTRCKRILDYSDPRLDAIEAPRVDGFLASAVRVQVLGLCALCKRGEPRKRTPVRRERPA